MAELKDRLHDTAWQRGYAAGFDDGARGHLPDDVLILTLPEGRVDDHARLIEAITKFLSAEFGQDPDVTHVEGGASE